MSQTVQKSPSRAEIYQSDPDRKSGRWRFNNPFSRSGAVFYFEQGGALSGPDRHHGKTSARDTKTSDKTRPRRDHST